VRTGGGGGTERPFTPRACAGLWRGARRPRRLIAEITRRRAPPIPSSPSPQRKVIYVMALIVLCCWSRFFGSDVPGVRWLQVAAWAENLRTTRIGGLPWLERHRQ